MPARALHRAPPPLRRWAAALSLLVASLASPARAQSIALDRFQPAPAGDRFLGIPSAFVTGHLALRASLLLDYAHDPLVLRRIDDGTQVGPIVERQTFVRLDASLALWQRLLLDLEVPALAFQSGGAEAALHAVDVGDIRLGLRTRLLGEDGTPFQLAAGGYAWLPTGTGDHVTDGHARALAPQIIAGGLVGPVLWSVSLAPELRIAQDYRDAAPQGSGLQAGGGAAVLIGPDREVQLGAELTAATALSAPDRHNLDLELIGHARYRFLDAFEIGAGAGPGLSEGLGTPAFRLLGLFAYSPGIALRPPDRDNEPDPHAPIVTRLGDDDPRVQAPASPAPPALPSDEAPVEPRAEVRAEVAGDEIVLSEEIYFDPGAETIDPRSERLLDKIAEALVLHPEIRLVEVRGHTDIHGTLPLNVRLAERRAGSVREALLRRSVDPARLTSRGYGPGEPAASNATPAGRGRNRRVELRILERAPRPDPH